MQFFAKIRHLYIQTYYLNGDSGLLFNRDSLKVKNISVGLINI